MRNSNDWDNGWLTHLISLLRGKKKYIKISSTERQKAKAGYYGNKSKILSNKEYPATQI